MPAKRHTQGECIFCIIATKIEHYLSAPIQPIYTYKKKIKRDNGGEMFMAQIVLCSVIQGHCFMLASGKQIISSQLDCQSEITQMLDRAARELPSYRVHYADCEMLPGYSI